MVVLLVVDKCICIRLTPGVFSKNDHNPNHDAIEGLDQYSLANAFSSSEGLAFVASFMRTHTLGLQPC
jgi:hypothetical protein